MPLLDTVRTIETPEGVSIRLRLAGPAPRALAWMFDFCIRLVICMAALMFLGRLGKFGFGIFAIGAFLLEWFYPVLFEVWRQGATPGKKMLNLAVLRDDGVPVGWSASVTRNLLRGVDILPFFYAFGLCSMFLNRDFKRLGDIVAKTVVVHLDKAKLPEKLPPGHALPPTVWLSSPEQQLIVAFAARSLQLTPSRVQELALIICPAVTRSSRQYVDVDSLFSYARHIVGER